MEELQSGNMDAPACRQAAATTREPGRTILLTPLAEDLLVDPAALLTVIAVAAWLLDAGERLHILIPHQDTRLTQDDLPPTFVAFLASHRLGPPDLLPISGDPEAAVNDVTTRIAQLATPDAIYGPDTHGLLHGIAALRRAGLAYLATPVFVIPFGVQSLLLARRCEFTSHPVSVDREFIELDLLRLADAVLVETALQQDYVARLLPEARCRPVRLPFPPWLMAQLPVAQAGLTRLPDRIVFLGSLSSAGGLELLRGMLQEFARLRRRLHVTLAGCVGPAAFGDPFAFVAEALADLRHDFDFRLSNDPVTLLSALDGTALVLVADKLPLRSPMLEYCHTSGLPVLDLVRWDWIEDWHSDAGSLSQRYIPYRAGAGRVQAALDGPLPHLVLPAALDGPPATPGALRATSLAQPDGQPDMAIVLCRARASDPHRWPAIAADCYSLIPSGNGFRLLGRDGPLASTDTASVAAVAAMLLDLPGHDCFAIFDEHATPAVAFDRQLPGYARAVARHGMLVGQHRRPAPAGGLSPARHLLQPLWHPLWLAPNAMYARHRLSQAAASPQAQRHRFSAFALWCVAAATGAPALAVPVVISDDRQTPRSGWQSQTARRRLLDHVIELAETTGSLSRDLAGFIHGVHGAAQIRMLNDLGEHVPREASAPIQDFQQGATGHAARALFRFARVVAALGRPEAALLLLDSVARQTGMPESSEAAALRARLAERVRPTRAIPQCGPDAGEAIAAARAAIDQRAAADAGAKLGSPSLALVSEADLDPATIRTIISSLLADYVATQRWDKFNALAETYTRQFGEDGIADRLRQSAAVRAWGPVS